MTTTNRTDARPENEPENVSSIICRFRSAFYRLRLAASDLACGEFVEKCHSHAGLVMQEATNDLEKVYEDLRAWHMHDDPLESRLREERCFERPALVAASILELVPEAVRDDPDRPA